MTTGDKLRNLATIELKARNRKDTPAARKTLIREVFNAASRESLSSDTMRSIWDIVRTSKPL